MERLVGFQLRTQPPAWFGSYPVELPRPAFSDMATIDHDIAVFNGATTLVSGLDVIGRFSLPSGTLIEINRSGAVTFIFDDQGKSHFSEGRAVEFFNALQLPLRSAITEHQPATSGGELITLVPQRINGGSIFRGTREQQIGPMWLPSPSDPSLNLRRGVVPAETIESGMARFVDLVGSGALDMAGALHDGFCAMWEHNFAVALVISWTCIEAVLSRLWDDYLDEHEVDVTVNGASLSRMSSTRRKGLQGSEFTSSIRIEVLEMAGRIGHGLYRDLSRLRTARNKWIHSMAPVGRDVAALGLTTAAMIIDQDFDLRLSAYAGPRPPSSSTDDAITAAP